MKYSLKSTIGILLFSASFTLQAEMPDPDMFIRTIYNSYTKDSIPINYRGTGKEQILSDNFLQMLNEDSRLAKGELGYLDADPICGCQDWETMHISEIKKLSLNNDTAVIRISYRLFDNQQNAMQKTLKLTAQNNRWYIDDIIDNDESLKQKIEQYDRRIKMMR